MPTTEPSSPERQIDILLQQYQLLEQRRKQFGSEFMQTFGFFFAAFAGLVALIGSTHNTLFRVVLFYAGILFLVISYLAHRLGQRQDDCELHMAAIEEMLSNAAGLEVGKFPRGSGGFGARKLVVVTLALFGGSLLTIALFWR
jgi:hypothetical protein